MASREEIDRDGIIGRWEGIIGRPSDRYLSDEFRIVQENYTESIQLFGFRTPERDPGIIDLPDFDTRDARFDAPIRFLDTRDVRFDAPIRFPLGANGYLGDVFGNDAQLKKELEDKRLMEVAAEMVRSFGSPDTKVRTEQEPAYTLTSYPDRIYDDSKGNYESAFSDYYMRISAPDLKAIGSIEGIAALGSALTYLLSRPAGPEEV